MVRLEERFVILLYYILYWYVIDGNPQKNTVKGNNIKIINK